jgi:hypothetical protein
MYQSSSFTPVNRLLYNDALASLQLPQPTTWKSPKWNDARSRDYVDEETTGPR